LLPERLIGANWAKAATIFLVVAATALVMGRSASGQPAPGGPAATQGAGRVDPVYGSLSTATGPAALDGQPVEPADAAQARRGRVAARAGDVVVTVGELEDYILAAPRNVQDTFRSPQGRRTIVERVLRGHLLALEAQRRGASDARTTHAAQRREERVLVDLLEAQVRAEAAANDVPEPPPPVFIPEERFAVILRTTSRAAAEAWRAEAAGLSFNDAATRGRAVGEVQETPYGQRDAIPEAEPAIERSLWRALYALDTALAVSPVISLGGGRFAAVFLAGITGGVEQPGPDRLALAMLAADRAMADLRQDVMARRVSFFEPARVDGVQFRFAPERSPAAMEQIDVEVRAAAQARAAAEQVAADEAAGLLPTGEQGGEQGGQ